MRWPRIAVFVVHGLLPRVGGRWILQVALAGWSDAVSAANQACPAATSDDAAPIKKIADFAACQPQTAVAT